MESHNTRSIAESLKYGVNLGIQNAQVLEVDELLRLLKKTYKLGVENNLENFPDLYETRILLKVTRDKLLSSSRLTKKGRSWSRLLI